MQKTIAQPPRNNSEKHNLTKKYIRHFSGVSNTTPFLVSVRLPRKLVVKKFKKNWKNKISTKNPNNKKFQILWEYI